MRVPGGTAWNLKPTEVTDSSMGTALKSFEPSAAAEEEEAAATAAEAELLDFERLRPPDLEAMLLAPPIPADRVSGPRTQPWIACRS